MPDMLTKVPELPYRRSLGRAFQLWAATRLIYIVVTYFAVLLAARTPPASNVAYRPRMLLYMWDRWDSGWYTSIALHGYSSLQSTAFFPLFPLLVNLLARVIGMSHVVLAGLIVANLTTLAAFWAIDLLATQELSSKESPRALLILAAYPLMFFTASIYTEGIFLAFATFSLLFTRRGAWRIAATFALLATLTRPTGVVLLAPMAWEYAQREIRIIHAVVPWLQSLRRPRQALDLLALVLAVPAGVGVYAAYLELRFGQPLAFLTAERIGWAKVNIGLYAGIRMALHNFRVTPAFTHEQAIFLVDLAPLVLAVLLTIASFRRMPLAFTLYLCGLIYLCVAAPSLNQANVFISSGRYLCAAVPLFLLLSAWAVRRPWLEMLLIGGGFMLQALFLAFFLAGGNIV